MNIFVFVIEFYVIEFYVACFVLAITDTSHNSHYPLVGGRQFTSRQFTPRHFIPAKHNDKTTILLKIIEYSILIHNSVYQYHNYILIRDIKLANSYY